ncbi:hypothetical protein U0C82_07870 [Fulvimarina sp. 2208YS6-2-32]|uniref:Flagellar assembly protein FliH/Type III secretion system HrpE domain-containing protein n=1 Tax=Fulvimarina uroteuthidis TaxID=3098149 RepID=A0ABU5I1U4_9HYPH|nr:hypothetical protein [Fulvimarina sp. 2208YS6-2-32]MDY8109060.1 hypothetical protein [Fulvimarina sp. 2208YS6-2-32]
MIPLAQYLNEQDGDGGFQSFAPKAAKTQERRKADFQAVGSPRAPAPKARSFESLAKPAPLDPGLDADPLDDSAFETDPDALYREMESELRRRAAPDQPIHDARALQNDLKERAGQVTAGRALDEARKSAYERGRSEALAQADADRDAAVEAALEAEREAAELRQAEAIEAARASWAETEGARLADALAEQTKRLSDAMRMTLSSILRPLAINARQRQSVDDLVEAIATLSYDGQAMSVKATGPADLLDTLRTALGDRAGHVTFNPSDDAIDVKVEMGQTVLQSRLGEWRNALEDALS